MGLSRRSGQIVLAVDVSDEKRLGACTALREVSAHTVQIDHHPTNPLYMEVNSVDGSAPATAVMIREQLKVLDVDLTPEIAVCLYTGISTDTGNFSFASTNAECFSIMSELMEQQLPLASRASTASGTTSSRLTLKNLSPLRYWPPAAFL